MIVMELELERDERCKGSRLFSSSCTMAVGGMLATHGQGPEARRPGAKRPEPIRSFVKGRREKKKGKHCRAAINKGV